MARDFDGVDDYITATITAIDTGDWTMGCWFYLNTDPSPDAISRHLISVAASSTARQILSVTSQRHFEASQDFSTTDASARTGSDSFSFDKWHCLFATFLEADRHIRMFRGHLDLGVAEEVYDTQVVGVGTRATAATDLSIGLAPFNGRISRPFFLARALTLNEMEAYRLGHQPIQDGGLRAYWPLDSPNSAVDLSGNGANGSVNGASFAEDPPIARHWMTGVPPVPEPIHLTGGFASSTSSATTASITPRSDRLVLIAVHTSRAGGASTPTVSGCGLTWTQVATIATGSSDRYRLTLFSAYGTGATTGTLTIAYGGVVQDRVAWSVDEFRFGVAVQQSATNVVASGTSITATLSSFAAPNNATYGAMSAVTSAGNWTAGTGFTELVDVNATDCELMVEFRTGPDTTVDGTFDATDGLLAIAAEIRAGY